MAVSWRSACAVCGQQYRTGGCPHGATVLADVTPAEVIGHALDLLAQS